LEGERKREGGIRGGKEREEGGGREIYGWRERERERVEEGGYIEGFKR
jgi:hypothetical protein